MTDEKIEKALGCCANINVKCVECPVIQECKGYGYDNTFLMCDVLKYITRLKAENDILKKNAAEAFQQGLNEKRQLIEPEIRQETAKEILQELDSRLWDDIDMNSDIGGAEHNQTIRSLIKFVKKKYSVEIEE